MNVAFYARTLDARNPVLRSLSWPALVAELQRYRPHSGTKEQRLRTAPLWSPVELSEPRRASACVRNVTALVLDYDDDAALTVPEALERWDGFERVGYTTWSHSEQAPRCRVVLPLFRPIPGEWWADLYRSVLRDQGQGADPQCCDPSRAYYLPAVGAGGPHYSERVEGERIDLWSRAQRLQTEKQREAQRRKEQRQRMARKAREEIRSKGAQETNLRRVMATDPDARRRLAVMANMKLIQANNGADLARYGRCPSCGRDAVWFAVDAGWAHCNHRQSCGWSASLYDYALLVR